MKRIAFAVLVLVLAGGHTGLRGDDSDLVAASKAAKAKRKTSTSKVITNADVKKSKGKVIEKGALPPLDETPRPGLLEQHETARTARLANEAQVSALEKAIATLEAELTAIERAYFEENDANLRDGTIVRRFTETKAKRDSAKKELAALLPPDPPNP
jgi:maltooligosyltrehalose synthase